MGPARGRSAAGVLLMTRKMKNENRSAALGTVGGAWRCFGLGILLLTGTAQAVDLRLTDTNPLQMPVVGA